MLAVKTTDNKKNNRKTEIKKSYNYWNIIEIGSKLTISTNFKTNSITTMTILKQINQKSQNKSKDCRQYRVKLPNHYHKTRVPSGLRHK